ncbi:ABC transporter ATP-binding protein [Corynebacterium epidermidicanis]|uniref:Trehalose import ATP-binding protein SugC n=1 Tax=Corynebacterium epidermidicanis TaxID=1050174 RepID=A0A0G3GUE9_9CORY|nr:sn-glycerol-3-phosphate ABC transporter ATP-binding protein UgpC [Corynebacterium epidermidicanis]AKK03148.1 ATPase component of ABC-type sugar transporter [Corynebacterium epidermidicanis]
MATVSFDRATRIYPGATTPSVDSFTLDVADGEFLVLVGPSGCGKSTTLRMLAGLEEVNDGRVLIDGKDVTKEAPKDRDIAMVFQNYALYPHMSVRENMGFALKIAGQSKEEINRRVEEVARTLGLTEYLDRKPKALSGGQRQRVAMGRAIVRKPKVFLMDEPLSNLDAKLRVQTRTQIAALQRELGVTTLYVTHDQTEALTMGDRIAVLNRGILQQVGTPRELYETPVNEFVAGFIGSPAMNLGTFDVQDGIGVTGKARIPLSAATQEALASVGEKQVVIGFRPESLDLVAESTPGAFPVRVTLVEELGSDAYIYGVLEGGGSISSGTDSNPDHNSADNQIVIRTAPHTAPGAGAIVWVKIKEGEQHNFLASTGERLPN